MTSRATSRPTCSARDDDIAAHAEPHAERPGCEAGAVCGVDWRLDAEHPGGDPFVTNPQDAKLLKSTAYRQRIAQALFDGVRKYQTSLKTAPAVAHQD